MDVTGEDENVHVSTPIRAMSSAIEELAARAGRLSLRLAADSFPAGVASPLQAPSRTETYVEAVFGGIQ